MSALILHARQTSLGRADARPLAVQSKRAEHDFYPTPPEATRALLSVESFDGPVWEPACGDGAIADVLSAAGHAVIGSDLINRGYGVGGVDFLAEPKARGKHIVTNPPYGRGLADAFILHALALTRHTGGSVAMLLNLASLCHPTRHALWTEHPPAAIYAIDELICWPNGDPLQAGYRTAQHRYCWVVWHPDVIATRFGWLRMANFA